MWTTVNLRTHFGEQVWLEWLLLTVYYPLLIKHQSVMDWNIYQVYMANFHLNFSNHQNVIKKKHNKTTTTAKKLEIKKLKL